MPIHSADQLVFHRTSTPEALLASARRKKEWRPTVVALVRHGGEYLVTREVKNRRRKGQLRRKIKRDVPKGGVEPYETTNQALCRELKEEVRLSTKCIRKVHFLGWMCVPFDADNHGRDGYTKGKLYLIFEVEITARRVAPGRDHDVIQIFWRRDFWNHFRWGRQKRRALSHPALHSALRHRSRISKLNAGPPP